MNQFSLGCNLLPPGKYYGFLYHGPGKVKNDINKSVMEWTVEIARNLNRHMKGKDDDFLGICKTNKKPNQN